MGVTKKVLIIDDDEIHNYLFTKRIINVGLSDEVESANSVDEGIELIQQCLKNNEIPKIIFLDLQMPGLDGWDFLKRYEVEVPEELKQKVFIFMLSSSVLPKDIQRAKKHSLITEYIKKPLMEDELFVIKSRYF